MKSRKNRSHEITRRDFLAGSAATFMALGLPMPLMADPVKLKQAPTGAKITKIGIYPTIGICRVGGASIADGVVTAPEVPGLYPNPEGGFKVGTGSIKKQVQRFFVYGFDENGDVVRELTNSDNVNIDWSVRVANTKAAWYGFNNPMDLGANGPGTPAKLRNSSITGDDREDMLVIDSGTVNISGNNINEEGNDDRHMLNGTFWGKKSKSRASDHFSGQAPIGVNLGKLQTDDQGRLKVVPSDGVSKSVIDNNPIVDFTKNDAWYDDWCDGTVHARVTLETGETLSAKPSWVVCCGPDFAPEIPPFTTLYDRVHSAMINKYAADHNPRVKKPAILSFSKDIYPNFHRLGLMKWVASAALHRQGWLDVGDFSDMDYIKKLADNSAENKAFRRHVFKQFRAYTESSTPDEVQYKLPYMAGSAIDYSTSPQRYYMMPHLQYWILKKWMKGHYDNDFDQLTTPEDEGITSIHDLDLNEQPHALTRAALEPLSGGAFHPGVELTWVLERPELFDDEEPFRIAFKDREILSENMGRLITPEETIPPVDGVHAEEYYPIGPQAPGDLTRWMGLPWQPDAYSCQGINFANDFPTLVWWPALLPVDVFPEFAFNQISRADLTKEEKMAFVNTRVPWSRGGGGIGYHAEAGYFDGLNRMVFAWEQMGFVVKKDTPADMVDVMGEYLYVEVDRGTMDLEFFTPPSTGIKPS